MSTEEEQAPAVSVTEEEDGDAPPPPATPGSPPVAPPAVDEAVKDGRPPVVHQRSLPSRGGDNEGMEPPEPPANLEMSFASINTATSSTNVSEAKDSVRSLPQQPAIYRVPVTLHKDENGDEFFYLKKSTFPNHNITKLNITYGDEEKQQMREQVLANNTCSEVVLKNCQIECWLGPASKKASRSTEDAFLTDSSFRLSQSKIAAIRMRMYAQQKLEAQGQLMTSNCDVVVLHCDVECRLQSKKQ